MQIAVQDFVVLHVTLQESNLVLEWQLSHRIIVLFNTQEHSAACLEFHNSLVLAIFSDSESAMTSIKTPANLESAVGLMMN